MTCQEETPQDQTANPISESAHLCSRNDTVEAIILYPSLGMPMVLGPGQEHKPEQRTCSLIIATGEKALNLFDVKGKERQAMCAYVYIDRHLRLTPINQPKYNYAGDTKQGGLCNDGTKYDVAQKSIKVWHLGEIEDEMLIANRHSKVNWGNKRSQYPFAVLASRLFGLNDSFDPADIYKPWKPSVPKPYEGMTHLWEVEIDLLKAGLIEGDEKITSDKFMNWAWLVETTQECRSKDRAKHKGEEKNFFLSEAYSHHEPQDRMIDDYLRHLAKSDRHYDHAKLYEVNLSQNKGSYPPPRQPQEEAEKYVKRLQSWHPVIRATSIPLKLAHLTDMHVSVRQDVLAKSKVRVIEDVSENTVGDKVAHAFWSFKALIKQMAKKKEEGNKEGVDTAFLLTGDYIDYNRNIEPNHVYLDVKIGKLWKDFNVLAYADPKNADKRESPKNLNADTPPQYLRGLDDTLVYSLVRNVYTEHKMPVFMINGNHEAYKLPYGVNPRFSWWTFWLAAFEFLRIKPLAEAHKKKLEKASRWTKTKTDERIPADLNLTIYEATLAYGPTYAQVPTSRNFDVGQFDWFHMLFTPFSDVVLALGSEARDNGADAQQILALLGWGGKENVINLFDLNGARLLNLSESMKGFVDILAKVGLNIRVFLKSLQRMGVDTQDAGILPRAKQSFSDAQKLLLEQAKALKKTNSTKNPPPSFVAASHFTMVSYELLTAFSSANAGITPSDKAFVMKPGESEDNAYAFNQYNSGTCEQNQNWFYQKMVLDQSNNVDWHISGHSHRSGLYLVEKKELAEEPFKVWIVDANDPGLKEKVKPDLVNDGKNKKESETRFLVSSSAGPLGKQNLKGEFGGYLIRPPSGSWIDLSVQGQEKVEQVKVARKEMNEVPRLCVIMDYMALMADQEENKYEAPIRFEEESRKPFGEGIEFTVSKDLHTWNCLNLNGMKIWLFQRKMTEGGVSGEWHEICEKGKEGKHDDRWHEISGPDDKAKCILNLSKKAVAELEIWLVRPEDVIKDESKLKNAQNSKEIMPSRYVLQAFCEIPLNMPKGVPGYEDKHWLEDLNWTDPWIFPLEIGIVGKGKDQKYYFRRPFGEKGEVPDWWFRAEFFWDKYIPADEAIDPDGENQNKPKGPYGK